jgi:hypothetical protein
MSLETGTASFRMFYVPECSNPEEATATMDRLAKRVLPDLERVVGETADGWVGPRHMMDRDLSLENVACHGWLRLQYVKACRKVPDTLLQALCKEEEQAELKARGCDCLPRAVRAEIKQRVLECQIRKAQPTLAGIGVWICTDQRVLLAEAVTDCKIDAFSPAFREVFRTLPICATPETAALKLHGVNANDLRPASWTPDATREPPVETYLGMEFLTWLFWRYEATGGVFQTRLHGPELGYMLEGPLTFYREGAGAFEVNIRKGNPLNSREAMACLLDGKMLSKARFVMASADRPWCATVDATFGFGSLRLQKGEAFEPGRGVRRALDLRDGVPGRVVRAVRAVHRRADRTGTSGLRGYARHQGVDREAERHEGGTERIVDHRAN